MECHNQASREKIQQVVDWFIADDNHNIVYNFHNEKQNRNTEKMKLYDLWYVKQMKINWKRYWRIRR